MDATIETFPAVPSLSYPTLRPDIRSGDILLCSGSFAFSQLIQKATKSVWSHIAFVIRVDAIGRIMVLESVETIGVRTVPLSSYVYNYNGTGAAYPGRLLIARHREFNPTKITALSKYAVDLLGYPYDKEEIARIAARIGMQNLGVTPTSSDAPPQKSFICSEYVYECFKSIGITIDYDPAGFIAPADFARCPEINAINYVTA